MAARRNLVTNPRAASDTTGWSSVSLGTFERVTSLPTSTGLPAGVTTGLHAIGAAANQRAQQSFAATNGVTYTVSTYIRLAAAGSGGQVDVEVRNAAGLAIGADSTNLSTVGGDFTRLSVTFTAATTDNHTFRVRQATSGTAEWHFTAALIEVSASLGTYFDGSMAGYFWEGTANASVSREQVLAEAALDSDLTFTATATEEVEAGTAVFDSDLTFSVDAPFVIPGQRRDIRPSLA